MYFLISIIVSFPAIISKQVGVYSGTSIYTHLGFGHWLYEKLDENKKGWRINFGYALRSGLYSSITTRLPNSSDRAGFFFSIGGAVNLRTIYQLNPNFGWVMGVDFAYEFLPTSSSKSAVVGGATFGIAF